AQKKEVPQKEVPPKKEVSGVDRRGIKKDQLIQLLKSAREQRIKAAQQTRLALTAVKRVVPKEVRPIVEERKILRRLAATEQTRQRLWRKQRLIEGIKLRKEKQQIARRIPVTAELVLRKPGLVAARPKIITPPGRPVETGIPGNLRRQINFLKSVARQQQSQAEEKTRNFQQLPQKIRQTLTRIRPEAKPPIPPAQLVVKPKPIISPEVKKHLAELSSLTTKIQGEGSQQVISAGKTFTQLLSQLKKKPLTAKPLPGRALPVERRAKAVSVYKPRVSWGTLIRRNAFKLVFLLLLLAWLGEVAYFTLRTKSADKLFEEITGAAREEAKPGEAAKPIAEKAPVDITFKTAKVEIEGRRDPFSPGVLRMEVIRRPSPTQIALAKSLEVISILRSTPTVVTGLPKEKPVVPRTSPVPQLTPPPKPELPSPGQPQLPVAARVTSERLSPVPEVSVPVVSPLVIPERKCNLVYRGRMVMEGIEYFFLEGEKRTYRATLGEEIEGYRLLKKDQDKLYLSKDGHIYEMGTK
ncbi:MAG: hypothetical protein NC911_10345, partial [Candidatus Omnitrophica bacterium]|nr:hypothetical protein [Candidatus Omnitrophota bacterium]